MSDLLSDGASAIPHKPVTLNWQTAKAVGPILLLCIICLFIGAELASFRSSVPVVKLQEVSSIDDCVKQMKAIVDPTKTDNLLARTATIRGLQAVCYDGGYKQAQLNEYQIRRMQFFEQYFAERIVLWMVVAITVSGVGLAGLQLAASYQLSLLGRGSLAESSEMTVEHSKIVLRSSAMGIFILLISFAFFFVFVTRMYPTKEVSLGDETPAKTPQSSNIIPGASAVIPPEKPSPPVAPPVGSEEQNAPKSQ
jgi:hypothetical protein